MTDYGQRQRPRLRKRRVALAAALMALAALLIYQVGLFLAVLWYSVQNPTSTAFMRSTLSALQVENPDAQLRHSWVDYDQISSNLKRAVIASEDSNFTSHGGIEWEAIQKAWEYNRRQSEKGGQRMRGGSTITQQLAKNLFLSASRSYWRKGQEMVLSYMIELVMSKRRILELYLNTAQWGSNIFGAQAAAQHYFKTNASALSASQAARLAAMLPNPAYYHRHGNTSYLRSRTNTIQQRLRLVEAP